MTASPSAGDLVRISVRGEVALIEVDNPPVNVLGPGVPEALLAAIDRCERDSAIRAMVIMGAGRTFIAGADLVQLQRAADGDLEAAADLNGLLARIEDCPTPIVMAIHGTALGGGLEVAMAGHYRIAAPDARLGLPEVSLGIIPGAQGTQRLPRLVGIARALDMCVTGRPATAQQALSDGLIDAIIDGDLTVGAIDFARDVARRGPHQKTRDRQIDPAAGDEREALFTAARRRAVDESPDQMAPLRAIDAIEAAAVLPFAQGCGRERELFFECIRTEQARTRIREFFAERTRRKAARDDS
jgi:3-hydroxyacyl-CoA dehydrogenase